MFRKKVVAVDADILRFVEPEDLTQKDIVLASFVKPRKFYVPPIKELGKKRWIREVPKGFTFMTYTCGKHVWNQVLFFAGWVWEPGMIRACPVCGKDGYGCVVLPSPKEKRSGR